MAAFMKSKCILALIILSVFLCACGDSDSPPPTTTQVSVKVDGPSTPINGAILNIMLPQAYVLPVDGNGVPTTVVLDPRIADATIDMNYVHPNLTIGIIRVTSFFVGDIVKITRPIEPGEGIPRSSDFTLVAAWFDVNGTAINGLTESLQVMAY